MKRYGVLCLLIMVGSLAVGGKNHKDDKFGGAVVLKKVLAELLSLPNKGYFDGIPSTYKRSPSECKKLRESLDKERREIEELKHVLLGLSEGE